MAASMVPGLLIGLRRTTAIDYDAVAYRTGAILAEDQGCAITGEFCLERGWENVDINNSGGRLGLAVTRGSQNILSPFKIEKFNDTSYLEYPESYRKLLIFGDYPYRFNITLRDENNKTMILVGDSIPESANYGYIKRAVKIKGDTRFEIDLNKSYAAGYNVTCFNCTNTTQIFKIDVNINETETTNRHISPLFQFKPLNEPINITIENLSVKFNWSNDDDPPHEKGFFNGSALWNPPAAANWSMWNETGYQPERATFNATLEKIQFYDLKTNPPTDLNVYPEGVINLTIINSSSSTVVTQTSLPLSNLTSIYENYTMILTIPPKSLFIFEDSILEIQFIFNDNPPKTLISGIHPLTTTAPGTIRSTPVNGWLEVAVW